MDDASKRALACVAVGSRVQCRPEEWPTVRTALCDRAAELREVGDAAFSLALLAEVRRLDALYGQPAPAGEAAP